MAVHIYSPLSFGTLSVISSILVIKHSLGGLVIIQSPCVESVIVIFAVSIVVLRTFPFLIHWIEARGLAVALQVNVTLLGDTTVRLVGGAVMTGTTVVE